MAAFSGTAEDLIVFYPVSESARGRRQ